MTETICPTCRKGGFEKEHYMKLHHVNAHGESIAGKVVECAYCGSETRKRPHEIADHEHNFCSGECQTRHHSDRQAGETNANYRGGVPEVTCHTCGEGFEKYHSQIRNGRTFCSEECRSEWFSEFYHGRNRKRVEVDCEYCGDSVETIPSRLDFVSTLHCSRECKNAAHAENMLRDGNPRWIGGHGSYRGQTWPKQRRRARTRDGNECFLCGLNRENHYGIFGMDLHVHHVTPFRNFDDSAEANRLSNLLTLCIYCHYRLEYE